MSVMSFFSSYQPSHFHLTASVRGGEATANIQGGQFQEGHEEI